MTKRFAAYVRWRVWQRRTSVRQFFFSSCFFFSGAALSKNLICGFFPGWNFNRLFYFFNLKVLIISRSLVYIVLSLTKRLTVILCFRTILAAKFFMLMSFFCTKGSKALVSYILSIHEYCSWSKTFPNFQSLFCPMIFQILWSKFRVVFTRAILSLREFFYLIISHQNLKVVHKINFRFLVNCLN